MLQSTHARSRAAAAVVAVLGTALIAALALLAVAAGTHPAHAAAAKHRVLFDASHGETAGNADWIIGSSEPDPLAQNANPSSDTDWTGAVSAWGVALQKTGNYSLKTLPAGNAISYGTSGPLDLSNFDEFVLPEANVRLTDAEKTAVMTFVQNGGGLFLIVDHTGSDRNNDGWDSPAIVNDLMTNNSVDGTDPFGFSVDLLNIVNDYPKAISAPANPVLNGPYGAVTSSAIYNGTTVTLHPADNANAEGLLYVTTGASGGNTGAFFVTSTFGAGRVAIWGDSSSIDDGTGESGNSLYNGWNDAKATNPALALNATEWLAGSAGVTPPPTSTNPPTSSATSAPGCTAGQLLGNPGFETGSAAPWTASSQVRIGAASTERAHTGTSDAWLGGRGTAHTDTLTQPVTLPSGCSTYGFGFWLHVDTAETGTKAWDTMNVQVVNGSGTVLGTLGTFSNVNAASGYVQKSYDLAAYAGQAVTLKFTATEGSKYQTSFVVDDASVTVS